MIDRLELLAVKSTSLRDPEYFYRKVCRYYSEKFHTPLIEVYSLPWAFVFTNYIEHIIETNNTQKEIEQIAIDICYPEKAEKEEESLQKWIEKVEKEEEEKRQQKLQEKEKEEVKEEESINMSLEDFSDLEKEMEEEVKD